MACWNRVKQVSILPWDHWFDTLCSPDLRPLGPKLFQCAHPNIPKLLPLLCSACTELGSSSRGDQQSIQGKELGCRLRSSRTMFPEGSESASRSSPVAYGWQRFRKFSGLAVVCCGIPILWKSSRRYGIPALKESSTLLLVPQWRVATLLHHPATTKWLWPE